MKAFIEDLKNSSQKKIIFSLLLISCLSTLTICAFMYKIFNEKLEASLHTRAVEIIDMIDYIAQTTGESPKLTKGVKILAANQDIKLIVVRIDNPPVVIASNKHALIGLPAEEIFPMNSEAKSFTFTPEKNQYKALASIWLENLIDNGQLTKASVGVLFDTTKTYSQLLSQILNTSIILIITMICVIAIVFLLTNIYIFKPLEQINKSLSTNSNEDKYTPIPFVADDEIGSVAKTLNRLFFDLYQSKISLHKQKERFDLAMQGTQIGLLDWNRNEDKLYCSSSVSVLLGISKEEFKPNAKALSKLIHVDDQEYAATALISHLKFNTNFDIELRIKYGNTGYVWVRARGQAQRDQTGKATRMVGYFVDISKRKEHEHFMNSLYLLSTNAKISLESKISKILKEAQSYLNMTCATIYKIENGTCTTKFFQCPSEYQIYTNSKFYLKDTLCSYTIKINDIVAIHNVAITNLSQITAHKKYGINSYISMPIYVHGKVYGTLSFFDKRIKNNPFEEREKSFVRSVSQWVGNEIMRSQYIDYLHETEIRLSEAVSELTNTNSELENFVYVASHDLQEPLRMITNFTGLLEKNYGEILDNTAKEYLNITSNSAVQMRKLIKALLDYAQASNDNEKTEYIDLNDVMNHVYANLEKQIQENHAVISVEDLPIIKGNRASIISLIQNLVSNGIKFQLNNNFPRIKISAKQNNDEWIISVKDNGIGIDPRYTSKIFEPFKRLHTQNEYKGTGIGLAVCKKITDRIGGKIQVEANKGVGTTFYITIPNQAIKAGKAA